LFAYVSQYVFFNYVEHNPAGSNPDSVPSQSQSADDVVSNARKLKLALFVASELNAALETGINPSWFQVKGKFNGEGFLDAAFAHSEMKTPSGKPARADWSVTIRLNADGSPDSEYRKITCDSAIESFRQYVANPKHKPYPKERVFKFLMIVQCYELGLNDEAEQLRDAFDFDGVDDDCFLQIAVADDVVYG
jgi:hypothetical protein